MRTRRYRGITFNVPDTKMFRNKRYTFHSAGNYTDMLKKVKNLKASGTFHAHFTFIKSNPKKSRRKQITLPAIYVRIRRKK